MLERLFKLKENRTDVRTEVIAGITTFMTMSYIIFVNPSILKAAGLPFSATLAATAIAAAIMTMAMGFFTNYPFALASGMGLNAVVTFSLCLGAKLPWQTAMGVIFVEGVVITLLVLTNVREAVMHAIPLSLKRAIGVGIGLFIAFIGLVDAKMVVSNPATVVGLGKFTSAPVLVSVFGVVITSYLLARRVKGSILWGILASTVLAILTGVTKLPTGSWVTTSVDLSTFGQLNVGAVLGSPALWVTVFAVMLTDFFDTMGTVIAIGGEAGFLDKEGKLPRLKSVLLVDSLAAAVGGLFSASSVTTYIESASGVGEGARTGLASVVTGLLFLAALPFAPIVGIVPAAATAPALIVVGYLMMTVVKDIPWDSAEDAIPAFLTVILIPLTYNISYGIGAGFISYTLIKALRGKFKEIPVLLWIVSLAFVYVFVRPL